MRYTTQPFSADSEESEEEYYRMVRVKREAARQEAARLKLGDEVIVKSPSHPHYKEVGTVVKEPGMVSILGGDPQEWLEVEGEWTVFGCRPSDVRRISDL